MLALLKISFSFYRKFVSVSVLINVFFVAFGIALVPALVYKLFLTGLVLWIYRGAGGKEQLIFYHNLKVSTAKLFLMCFGWDLLILTGTYLISGIL